MINIPDFILLKDKEGNIICPRCKNLENKCICISLEDSKNNELLAILTTEKCKKGKVVTIVSNLRPDQNFLKKITKELKIKFGTGGNFHLSRNEGIITIQGNKLNEVEALLRKKNIKAKIR